MCDNFSYMSNSREYFEFTFQIYMIALDLKMLRKLLFQIIISI